MSSGACQGDDSSIGWYRSNPCTLLFDFLAAPATFSVWLGAKRYCRFLELSEDLRASYTAERHNVWKN